jgi:ribosomal protein S18 acetylase RimI-like enzyme
LIFGHIKGYALSFLPSTTFEYTSAGLGEAHLITVDIDYTCSKIAEGLAAWYQLKPQMDPVVANFWFLPFKANSMDVVCSHYGIDESREITRVLTEISRVLKDGGRFVSVSRMDPILRFSILRDLELCEDDLRKMASAVGIYSGSENLVETASHNGLVLENMEEVRPANSHQRVVLHLQAFQDGEFIGECGCISCAEVQDVEAFQDWLYVDWLGVEDDFQGRGLGKYLLRRSLKELYDIGYRHASISCAANNGRAFAFYSNCGFRAFDWSYIFVHKKR